MMSNVVNVIQWTPKKEGSGCFVTKVPHGSGNAQNFKGQLPNGVKYNYWGVVVGKIHGTVVWVDNKFGDFGNKFIICLKSDTGLIHIIEAPYNVAFIRSFLNRFANADKTLSLSVSYFAYDKTDRDGNLVLSKTTKTPIREGSFLINQGGQNVPSYYDKSNPMPKGTEWVKTVISGRELWDSSPELRFWERAIMKIQKDLLESGQAIPFTYNSLLCGALENPTKNRQPDEIKERARGIWESLKGNYKFSWQTGTSGSSSEEFNPDFYYQKPPAKTEVYDDGTEPIYPANPDDLPF